MSRGNGEVSPEDSTVATVWTRLYQGSFTLGP